VPLESKGDGKASNASPNNEDGDSRWIVRLREFHSDLLSFRLSSCNLCLLFHGSI
jgi:hypothetical protein